MFRRNKILREALKKANEDQVNMLFRLAQLGDKEAIDKIKTFYGKIK